KEGAVPKLPAMATEWSRGIVAGVSDRDGSRSYNAQAFIDVHGTVIGKYRKAHLVTAAPLDERPCITASGAFTSCEIDKFNLGLTICYDLRFSEVCRALAVERRLHDCVNASA